jgi:hypothetical protein
MIATFFAIIFAVTACGPTQGDISASYSVKEKAYLSDVRPVLGGNAETAVQQSAVIAVGKLACKNIDSGTPQESVVADLADEWSELEARVMVSSAVKYFCK